MFSYENFKIKMKHHSEEKIKNLIYTCWYGNTILLSLLLIVLLDISAYLIGRYNITLYYTFFITLLAFTLCYFVTRKSGLAITENRYVYVIFKHLTFKERKVYEIPKEKIKSITIHKFLYLNFVSISFIDITGKLETKKFYYSSFMVGPGSEEFKKDSKIITNELIDLQKKLDRGDF